MSNTISVGNDKIFNLLIFADKVCDYTPVLSCLSNIIDVVVKGVLHGGSYAQEKSKISENKYFTYLHEKKIRNCLILSLPFAGIVWAVISAVSNFFKSNGLNQKLKENSNENSSSIAEKPEQTEVPNTNVAVVSTVTGSTVTIDTTTENTPKEDLSNKNFIPEPQDLISLPQSSISQAEKLKAEKPKADYQLVINPQHFPLNEGDDLFPLGITKAPKSKKELPTKKTCPLYSITGCLLPSITLKEYLGFCAPRTIKSKLSKTSFKNYCIMFYQKDCNSFNNLDIPGFLKKNKAFRNYLRTIDKLLNRESESTLPPKIEKETAEECEIYWDTISEKSSIDPKSIYAFDETSIQKESFVLLKGKDGGIILPDPDDCRLSDAQGQSLSIETVINKLSRFAIPNNLLEADRFSPLSHKKYSIMAYIVNKKFPAYIQPAYLEDDVFLQYLMAVDSQRK